MNKLGKVEIDPISTVTTTWYRGTYTENPDTDEEWVYGFSLAVTVGEFGEESYQVSWNDEVPGGDDAETELIEDEIKNTEI